VADAQAPTSLTPLTLDTLAPNDPWRHVRVVALVAFAGVFAYSFKHNGLPVARLAVLGWVAVAFVVGSIGRPLHRVQQMVFDLVVYTVMWLSYDFSRGVADALGSPLQVEAPRNIDRFLFFGHDPTVWMQRRFYHPGRSDIRWYDVVGSLVYFSHFLLPVLAAVVLWLTSRTDWVRYLRRFATVLVVAVTCFVLLPTAPPWMAADRGLIGYLSRGSGRGWFSLGLSSVSSIILKGRTWANPVAAFPSLHAAYALFVVAFFLPRMRWWWLKGLALLFPLAMGMALVYFGEHWVIDVLAGWALVGGSFPDPDSLAQAGATWLIPEILPGASAAGARAVAAAGPRG